jgi:hypothetical protein
MDLKNLPQSARLCLLLHGVWANPLKVRASSNANGVGRFEACLGTHHPDSLKPPLFSCGTWSAHAVLGQEQEQEHAQRVPSGVGQRVALRLSPVPAVRPDAALGAWQRLAALFITVPLHSRRESASQRSSDLQVFFFSFSFQRHFRVS